MKNSNSLINVALVLVGSVIVTSVFLAIAKSAPDLYVQLTNESTGVELATALFYLIAGVSLLVSSIRNYGLMTRTIFPILLALFFVFIAGEEESWGMWIFGFDAPETIAEINTQGELTIHNLGVFSDLITPQRVLNLFVLFFGIVLPVLHTYFGQARRLIGRFHVPVCDIRVVPWFAVAIAYERLSVLLINDSTIEPWRHTEVSEFLYATGFLICVVLWILNSPGPRNSE